MERMNESFLNLIHLVYIRAVKNNMEFTKFTFLIRIRNKIHIELIYLKSERSLKIIIL